MFSTLPNPTFRSPTIVLATCALLALAAACQPISSGKKGTLFFQYVGDDALIIPEVASTPIAAGAQMELVVYADTERTPVTVDSASSSDPAILEVLTTTSNRVVLRGVAAGTAEIVVRTASAEDSIDIRVAALGRVSLTAPQATGKDGATLVAVGGTVPLGFAMYDAGGKGLTGHGLHPVTIDPDGAATIAESNDIAHLQIAVAQAGVITLSPQGGNPVTMTAVASTEVDSLAFEGADVDVQVGNEALVVLRATTADGAFMVGLSQVVTVTSDAAVCTLALSRNLPSADDTYVLSGKAGGTCNLTASLGTVSTSASVVITP